MPAPPATPSAAPEIVVADDLGALVGLVAARVRAAARDAIAARGRFRIALAGGSTPRALYPSLIQGIDWTRAEIFYGDERAVPPDHPDSNHRMARETLLDVAGIPASNVYRWAGEAAELDLAAADYERTLKSGQDGPPWLDLALLGLGADGHTASLFPGSPALHEARRLAVATVAPTLGATRLTLTYPALETARQLFFVVTGPAKAAALAAVVDPASDLPAARLVHRAGPVAIFCDRTAFKNRGKVRR